ncbi:hypothetical protein [Runella aurantiaca]|uniref:Uncharacterized protein n=1 Tax=Runella aurantiaca TaxID=2282308 RepID=A0A369I5H9_9BACT|nr:hypothetical protein [Runella aurantiaca]RDB03515.1 hypothetical protein DVG78_23685 [Runella aurantiaca]
MPLSKSTLMKIVRGNLLKMNYVEFKDSIMGSSGLFIKKINTGYFLTLGMIVSRYYEEKFTCAYYLSKSTRWSAIWGDIPPKSYERPSYLLTNEELQIYPKDIAGNKLKKDIWWNPNNNDEMESFYKILKLTEERFINQPELIAQIEDSKEITEFLLLSNKVIEKIKSDKIDHDFKFLPIKSLDDIPIVWFKAAEIVLSESNLSINKHMVKTLAADSFRKSLFNF